MENMKLMSLVTDLPRLIGRQALKPLFIALRKPLDQPKTQKELADLVNGLSLIHI